MACRKRGRLGLDPVSGQDAYFGAINTNNFSIYLFFEQINKPEVATTDVGNAYLHIFSKDDNYIIVGPGKYNKNDLSTKSLIPQHR